MLITKHVLPRVRTENLTSLLYPMEKKSAYLDLKGRRASTTPVLSENLAILVRDKPYTRHYFFYLFTGFGFCLATPTSSSSLSSSSILDAILFT